MDFADIRNEFDKTNKAYFNELQEELGDEFQNYANIFKSYEEIKEDIENLKNKLFIYDTENLENFTREINNLPKEELYAIRKALENYKTLYNLIKMYGYEDLTDKIDISRVSKLANEVTNRINILNLTDTVINSENMTELLNVALDKIDFNFTKISEAELVIADKYRTTLETTRQEFERNFDKKDPEFVSLFEELKRIFTKKNIEELTADEMQSNMLELVKLRDKAKMQNTRNEMLVAKYENDIKFVRIHKRLKEAKFDNIQDYELNKILLEIKHQIDEMLVKSYKLMDNVPYFIGSIKPVVMRVAMANGINVKVEQIDFIANNILEEYVEERKMAG